MHFEHHPSEQTYAAIGHCREPFAATRGTGRNAVDQMMAGNTLDPYVCFRSHFKDVCATPQADPDAYLNDLQGIKQMFRPSSSKSVCEAFLTQMGTAQDLLLTCAKTLEDGKVDRKECIEILNRISETFSALEQLKQSVIDKKNELSGAQIKGLVVKR
jgi:hypothetical protein